MGRAAGAGGSGGSSGAGMRPRPKAEPQGSLGVKPGGGFLGGLKKDDCVWCEQVREMIVNVRWAS